MTDENEVLPPVASRFASLRARPGLRYTAVGLLSVLLDVGVLRLLHGQLHVALLSATAVSFAAATGLNFGLNRQWVFHSARAGAISLQFPRFLLLVAFNFISTLVIVGALSSAGTYYLIAKLIAIAVNAAFNFFALRHWVFRQRENGIASE